MYDSKKLDMIMHVALTNFFTEAKQSLKISLARFDKNNDGHLALYRIAQVAHDIFDFSIELEMGKWEFFWFKRKYKCGKYVSRASIGEIDCYKFIDHIESANKMPGAFADVYLAYYYKRKD